MQTAAVIPATRIDREPYYLPVHDEIAQFEAAYAARLPVMIKGPTGCGKTRFIEHMAWRLSRQLVTVACNEDTSASDLIGRFLLNADGTYWQDGPLTRAARTGAICYLDEIHVFVSKWLDLSILCRRCVSYLEFSSRIHQGRIFPALTFLKT